MTSYSAGAAKLHGVALLLLLIGACMFAAWLYMLGSVIIRDPDRAVANVFLKNSADRLTALRLPFGLHVSTAKLEGEAVIHCRNGKDISLGYVTGGWHIRKTVRAQDCSPTASIILNS